jgi:hypothetical protein
LGLHTTQSGAKGKLLLGEQGVQINSLIPRLLGLHATQLGETEELSLGEQGRHPPKKPPVPKLLLGEQVIQRALGENGVHAAGGVGEENDVGAGLCPPIILPFRRISSLSAKTLPTACDKSALDNFSVYASDVLISVTT